MKMFLLQPKLSLVLIIFIIGYAGAMKPKRGHRPQNIGQSSSSFSVAEYIVEAIPKEDKQMIRELSDFLVICCHTIGMVTIFQDAPNSTPKPLDLAVVWPTGLLPSPFPAELFDQALETQQFVNELYFRISLDLEFLYNAYKDMMETDKWIQKQVELMEKVRYKIRQQKTLIFNRADYLTHQLKKGDPISLKQVEVGTGQLGGPGYGQRMSLLHKYMLNKIESMHYQKPPKMSEGTRTESKSTTLVAESMFLAWKSFMEEFNDPKAVIVFLFDEKVITVSSFDQLQFMQMELGRLAMEQGHYANVVLVTIPESPKRIRLNEKDGHLYVDGNKRVGLLHMSVGLLPHHWKTEKEWETRFQMETSNAIISPNIRVQLAGTKRIQQLLAMPKALERFFDPIAERHKIEAITKTFVKLWGLEKNDADTYKIVNAAINMPDNFVLKAQLGSGKGNYFGSKIAEMLKVMSKKERSAYTLMEKIRPISVKNYIRRPFHNDAILHDVDSELSIFGTYLGNGQLNVKPNGNAKIFNRTDGFRVRSKLSTSDQVNLSTNDGFQDSLLLFPEIKFR